MGTVYNVDGAGFETIIGGTIDGVSIGQTTPGPATFSALTCPSVGFSGGSIDGVAIGIGTPAPASFTNINDTSLTTDGIVHNNTSGFFTTSLIVDADITVNSISNSRLNQVPPNTIRGNNTGSTADIINLTPSEVASMIGATFSPALTNTYVGFGDGSNLLTGNSQFIYDSGNVCLSIDKTTSASSDSTAILKLTSTNSFFYPPAMSSSQRTSVSPSRGGAMCYDTDLNQGFMWNGSAWVIFA